MRVLVCGDRNWTDQELVNFTLDRIHARTPIMRIIEGEARGADTCGRIWGVSRVGNDNVLRFPANWRKYGKAAGPIRNQQMLTEGRPDLVIAFHSDIAHSKGTADMKKRAEAAGLPVRVVSIEHAPDTEAVR